MPVYKGVQYRSLDELDPSVHQEGEREKVAEAIAAARRWIRETRDPMIDAVGHGLVLLAREIEGDETRSGTGVGKTHIAQACLDAGPWWTDVQGKPIARCSQFVMARTIIRQIGDPTILRSMLRQVPALAVDDVGSEGFLPYVTGKEQSTERQDRYFYLVNFCYQVGIDLIMTANLGLDEFRIRIGKRAWSRLMEMAPRGMIVDLTGVRDYRYVLGNRVQPVDMSRVSDYRRSKGGR